MHCMLSIQNLSASVEQKNVLNNINLEIQSGETVALIGHNGSGKSSLAQIICGNKDYICNSESIVLCNDKNLLELEPHSISRLGLFVSFQNPVEVPNVPLLSYLKLISDESRLSKKLAKFSAKEFMIKTRKNLELLEWNESWLKRNLNEGMSGGEKKKSEILQLLTLDPEFVVLDEIDSGLDTQSLKIIGQILHKLQQARKTIVIITHNKTILEFLRVDRTVELKDGTILSAQ